MNVLSTTASNNKQFTRASEVKIPDVYNRRFKTGADDLDALFGGQGFLPGATFTLAAAPGTGKTSLLIQTLELLEMSGKKTAFISGEEGIEQIAFASKRLNVQRVPIANLTDIDEICDAIVKYDFDFVVLDSLPALTVSRPMNSKQKEEYIVTRLIQTAKENECVIATIMHFTKTGTYKGSTLLPHSVDCTIIMTRNEEDETVRDIEVTKNRFGSTGTTSFRITSTGFDFQAVEAGEGDEEGSKRGNKGTSKKQVVLQALTENKNLQQLVTTTGISVAYLTTILRELQLEGRVKKDGRGVEANFSIAD